MRSLGGYLYLLALAVWVGGGALYMFVLTPAIFGQYPRNTAGDVVGTMMPYYFAALLGATALAAVLLAAFRRYLGVRWPAVCLVLALARTRRTRRPGSRRRCGPAGRGGSLLG